MSHPNLSGQKLALFDVDETLLNFNSMLHFLNYFFIEYFGEDMGKQLLEEHDLFLASSSNKYSREVLNRNYYKNFKGVNEAALSHIGKKWFKEHVANHDAAFNSAILEQLINHKKNDYFIVLVSGGFFAPIDPLSQFLNIDLLLCITPTKHDGFLTGDIEGIQTIGQGKADAIKNHFKNECVDWDGSYCYGDHISDLYMLELVGNPVVVGKDQELLERARANNWQIY